MFREVNGFQVPADEIDRTVNRRFKADGQISQAVKFCKEKRVAVQAGGNWGYWPLRLSKQFATVYTFEPGPVAFACLAMNTAKQTNLIRMQAALGDVNGTVGIVERPGASGHTRVDGSGMVPVLRLDNLELEVCDLIYLDVEGYECRALHGAQRTVM